MLKTLTASIVLFSALNAAAVEMAVQVKRHTDNREFTERPYGKDDMSYGLFFEASEGLGAWRLGASYLSDATGFGEADSVITPEVTLMGQDGIWEGGVSTLIDYVDAGGQTEWGDIYFQVQLGLRVPITSSITVSGSAYYPFESFGEIGKFRTRDVDYGASVRIRF